MTVTALPPTSTPPGDWWRRVFTAVNALATDVVALQRRSVATATGAYTAAKSDYLILADATAADVTITLPSPAKGKQVAVKRLDGSAHAVSVAGSIEGATPTALAAQWDALNLIGDGAQWLRL